MSFLLVRCVYAAAVHYGLACAAWHVSNNSVWLLCSDM